MSDAEKNLTIGIAVQMQDASGARQASDEIAKIKDETKKLNELPPAPPVPPVPPETTDSFNKLAGAAHGAHSAEMLLEGHMRALPGLLREIGHAAKEGEGGLAGIATSVPVWGIVAGVALFAFKELFEYIKTEGEKSVNDFGETAEQAYDSAKKLAELKLDNSEGIKSIGDAKKAYDELAAAADRAATAEQKVRDAQAKKDKSEVDVKEQQDIAGTNDPKLIAAIHARAESEKLVIDVNNAKASSAAKEEELVNKKMSTAEGQEAAEQALAEQQQKLADSRKYQEAEAKMFGISEADAREQSDKYKAALKKLTEELERANKETEAPQSSTPSLGVGLGGMSLMPAAAKNQEADEAAATAAHGRLDRLKNLKALLEENDGQEKALNDEKKKLAADHKKALAEIAVLERDGDALAIEAQTAQNEALLKIAEQYRKAKEAGAGATEARQKGQVGGDNEQFQKAFDTEQQIQTIIAGLKKMAETMAPTTSGGAAGIHAVLETGMSKAEETAAKKNEDAIDKAATRDEVAQAKAAKRTEDAQEKHAAAVELAQEKATKRITDAIAKHAEEVAAKYERDYQAAWAKAAAADAKAEASLSQHKNSGGR